MKKTLYKVLIGSLFVLLVLVIDAWRSGKIKIYSQKNEKREATMENKEDNKAGQKAQSDGKTKKNTDKKVRVLLSTTNFAGLYHDKVTVRGTKGMTVRVNGSEKTYSAGKKASFAAASGEKQTIEIKPASDGRLELLSIKRQNRTPSYRGNMELNWTKQGYTVINELPIEQYLYAVVPSEISSASKMEALKAQAVCARTYAYNQIAAGRFEEYHADLDDSVSCQVYNNAPEDKRSRKAVNDTGGQVVTRDAKRVQTYYYSTSWGKSASGQEVWETEKEISYLQSCVQQDGGSQNKTLNLSGEDAFRSFLARTDIATYDDDSEWYRWSVTIPLKTLEKRIDSALQSCYARDANKVLTQQKDGAYRKKPLKSIGKLKKIRVEKRGESGLVTELVVVGTKNVVKVCSQYNVRVVLSPGSIPVHLKKRTTTASLLPSAAFYIDMVKNKKKSRLEIHGGGFGHGTGMSQCGAVQMAKLGKNYKEILKFYFAGCEVTES